ncbi:P-loop containing nucleoside triphosphate hydrolase protein [Neolentinus lepideus HHB14362 ss-1]|uniref:p-loop containing nucleoside triphosphate hydrolase protein n=1 Tax=Neolentinus lepideus HHB14362 ss-1 TaxID=1314782 RepID=A0A165VJX8_9AGAM|nr:P-loop containing nucleoside triphosphate hydrolase protein [Neolentinus lepideus HHB14362 ss-1]
MSKRPKVQVQINQTLLDVDHPQIQVSSYREKDLDDTIFDAFLGGGALPAIGVSVAYAPRSGILSAIALCLNERVLVVQLASASAKNRKPSSGTATRHILEERILLHTSGGSDGLYGFDMHQIVLSLWRDHSLSVSGGIDIQSVYPSKNARRPLNAIKFCLGDDIDVHKDNVSHVFGNMNWDPKSSRDIIQRSWLSWFLAVHPSMEEIFRSVPRIDVRAFTPLVLSWLSKAIRVTQCQEDPREVVHDYSDPRMIKQGKLEIRQERFQNRIRNSSSNQQMQFKINTPEGSYSVDVQPSNLRGRRAQINTPADLVLGGKLFSSLMTTGSGDPTQAEALKASIILDILQKKIQPFDNPWLQMLYQDQPPEWPDASPTSLPPLSFAPTKPLNDSQILAASQMLSRSRDEKFTIIQGPPGTGKTSVIGQFVLAATSGGLRGIWLVAKSNIAVKNIAEKLYDLGFMSWRLVVSTDFHNDWHEHLYTSIRINTIQSDKLSKMSPNVVQQRFGECQVVLCTLGMLSNSQLQHCGVTKIIPMETLVIDEASQIDVNDYIPVFTLFGTSLQKVCFIGDNKQLPPFAKERVEDLMSIFEIPHLAHRAIFLNIQYRMPPTIGDFISQHVYEGKLQSNPEHPVTGHRCFFIDISGGKEISEGTSWMY